MHYIFFALRSSEMLQLYSLKLIVKQSYGKICTHTPIKTYDAVQFYSVQYSLSQLLCHKGAALQGALYISIAYLTKHV